MLARWLDDHLDPDWRVADKLWSMRIAFIWALIAGLYMALPAFQGLIDPFWFAGLCVAGAILVMIGRLTHQPGLD